MSRISNWTCVCSDVNPENGKLEPYIRCIGNRMELEKYGRPWGVSVSKFFRTHEEANQQAEILDEFFENMLNANIERMKEDGDL